MSSVVIQSNSQSALLSTLNSATGSLVQPFEYSISKRVPPHGKSVLEFLATNPQATGPSQTISWDLPKTGIVRSMAVKFEVDWTQFNNDSYLTYSGFLNAIDRVEIESSSRKLLTHTRASLMAAYADLPSDARCAFERGLHMDRAHTTPAYTANADTKANDRPCIILPLLFCTTDAANQSLMTEFLEPVRVSVRWSANRNFFQKKVAGTGTNAATRAPIDFSFSEARLILETIQLEPSQMDALIATQYGSGPLSQLQYDYFEETPTGAAMKGAGADGVVIAHEIKSSDVVSDIYVFVEATSQSLGADPTVEALQACDVPIPLEKVTFKASGQTLIEVKGEYLEQCGRRTMKEGFFGSNPIGGQTAGPGTYGRPGYVYRLQMGLDNAKQFCSGAISLRELNSPTIEVQVGTISTSGFKATPPAPLDNVAVKMHVILRTQGLVTTDSNSGRVVSSLSN